MCEICNKFSRYEVTIGGRRACEECVDKARILPPRAATLKQAKGRLGYTRGLLNSAQRGDFRGARLKVNGDNVPVLEGKTLQLFFFVDRHGNPFAHIELR